MTCIRILHVVGAMDRAGAETMIMNLYREVDRAQYQFDFLYFRAGPCDYDDEIAELGGRTIHVPARNPISRILAVHSVLSKGNWSIVHSHTLFSSGLHLLAARLAGIPKRIAHAHSASSAIPRTLTGRFYRRAMTMLLARNPTDYIACGKAAEEHLFPRQKNVTILPNAIDVESFIKAFPTDVSDIGVQNQPALAILQIGRLMEVKNHEFSITIALALKEKNVDFKMFFVGDGPLKEQLQAAIAENNLEDYIILVGLREDIAELMAMADVMLMPSLYEGFPVVLVESQAAGLPAVIASTISHEVDLGVGLVKFMGLEESSETWASQIVMSSQLDLVPTQARREAITAKGFCVDQSVEKLLKVYQSR